MPDPKGNEAAQQVAAEVAADQEPRTLVGAQTEGEIENPHDGHVDSWSAEKKDDGSVEVNKEHTPVD